MGNRFYSDLPEGWKGAFLVAWGRGLTVERACEEAGISPATVYRIKERDEAFRAEWEAAKEMRKLLRADKAWKVVDQIMDDPDHKDRLNAAKLTIEKNDPDGAQRVDVNASGEVKFVVVSAFQEDDGQADPTALPGEPETA